MPAESPRFVIYCDERSDELLVEHWNVRTGVLRDAEVRRLPSLRAAPDFLADLLEWERVDWLVAEDAEIRCVVEFSGHGYTGDNSFQRFARIYRAATLGIPSIYCTPFSRTRLNELDVGRHSPRNVAPELFQTMLRLSESMNVPCVAVHWPTGPAGTHLPLIDPACQQTRESIVNLVRAFCEHPGSGHNTALRPRFDAVLDRMDEQARLPFRGSVVRSRVQLPLDIADAGWIWSLLPADYFGMGKADKLLASAALRANERRPVIGTSQPFWEENGEAIVLFLGYQWRPDPASGLIALSAAESVLRGAPLIVVWPRVFHSAVGARGQLLSALKEFKRDGTGPFEQEAELLGFSGASIERLRARLSVADRQFGVYSHTGKVGRILHDTANLVVLGDAIVVPQ